MPYHEMSLHHRQQRSVGGEDVVHNLVAVMHACHMKIHFDNNYYDGWLVVSTDNPKTIPIRMFDGWRFL